ncbi:MAG: replicative DNA helicase [Actinobacteria bacterium]|nr:replicative DNA helicase [Actinomycetota bacterium]
MTISEFRRDSRELRDDRNPQRIPPHNVDAEASLLGAMLLSEDAIATVLERGLVSEDFYKPAHRHVFDAIRALTVSGNPVDPITVGEELRRAALLESIGGIDALLRLQNATPAISSAERYAKIVRDAAKLRRVIAAAAAIAEIAYSEPADVDRALDEAESRIYDVSSGNLTEGAEELGTLLNKSLETIEERWNNPGAMVGVPTGFKKLDELLLGLQPGALHVIGARPGMGKSALALNMAVNVARLTSRPVIFFSLEMSAYELSQRVLASEASVPSEVLRGSAPNEKQWQEIGRAVGRLDIPLIIDDSPMTSIGSMRARARRIRLAKGDLALIVIDYLQLMGGDAKVENRQLEVSEISRNLKLMAREFGVPIVALSQLSRNLESRGDKRPNLSDLRESGAIEQDADVVMFIYRGEVVGDSAACRHDSQGCDSTG